MRVQRLQVKRETGVRSQESEVRSQNTEKKSIQNKNLEISGKFALVANQSLRPGFVVEANFVFARYLLEQQKVL